jgi:hypothetical protein
MTDTDLLTGETFYCPRIRRTSRTSIDVATPPENIDVPNQLSNWVKHPTSFHWKNDIPGTKLDATSLSETDLKREAERLNAMGISHNVKTKKAYFHFRIDPDRIRNPQFYLQNNNAKCDGYKSHKWHTLYTRN